MHSLPAAVGCQQVSVCRAEARLPCCRKGWACGSEFEALSTGVGRAWDVWLELQHEGPMVAGYLAHARLTALLQQQQRRAEKRTPTRGGMLSAPPLQLLCSAGQQGAG